MNDERKTKMQLVRELKTLQAKTKSLEKSDNKRKHLVEELRKSEERYRSLVTFSPDAIYVHVDGRVAMVNPSMCQLLGAEDPTQLIGKSVFEIAHPDYHVFVRERWREVFTGQFAPLVEEKFVRLDGTTVDVEVNAVAIDWEGTTAVQVVARDITERKQAEQARNRTEARLRQREVELVEAQRLTRMGNWQYDLEANKVTWSEELYRIFEVKKTEFEGLYESYLDRVHPDDRALVLETSNRARRTGEPFVIEYRIVTGTGKQKHIVEHGYSSRDAAGTVVGLFGVAQDVTDQKQAEAELKRALEWQEAIFEGSRDAIFISDQDSRFLAINKAACSLTGYSPEELLAMRIPDVHDHIDLEAYKTYNERIFAGEEVLSEARILRRDGTKVQTEFNNRRVSIAGKFYMHTSARDISERKRVEQALQKSEKRWRSLASNSPDFIALHDREGRYLFLNRFAEGYSEHDVLGRKAEEFIAPEWRGAYTGAFQACIDTMAEQKAEYVALSDLAAMTTYESSFVPIPGEGDEINVLVVARDISERKREEQARTAMEQALRESEVRYRQLFDASPDGVVLIGPDGRITQANIAQARMYRYDTPAALIGIHATQLVAESSREYSAQILQRRLSGEIIPSVEYELARKDGTTFFGETSATTLRSDDGISHGYICVTRDTTDRKLADFERTKAEQALRESEERYRRLVEQSPDAILVHSRGKIVYANAAAILEAGAQHREELLGRNLLDFVHPDSRASVLERLGQLDRGIEVPLLEEKLLRLDGTIIEAEVVSIPTTYGSIKGAQVIIRDISERKRNQRLVADERNLLRSIIDAIPDEIVVKDLERKFVLANTACLRALGKLSLDQVVGLRDEDFIAERFARDAREKENRVLESGETLFNDIPEPRRNRGTGELERMIMSTKTPLRDGSGRTTGLVTVNRNITALQRAQEALRQSEIRFRTVWDSALDAMRLTDADGTIVMVNRSFCQLFKKGSEEVVGRSLAVMYLPIRRENTVEDYRVGFRSRTILPRLEADLTIWSSEELSVDISNTFVSVPEQPELLLSVFRDTSQRKHSEKSLLAIQEQLHQLAGHLQSVREEERKHLSQEFHDQLGQMLTALKMDLSILNRSVNDPAKELSRKVISVQIESMTAMIDRVVGIIREIMSDLRPEMLDQLGLIPTLEWEAERFQRHSGIPCTFRSEVTELPLDPAKSIALYRIFQEALTNIARHAQASRVEAALQAEKEVLNLTIRDNGVGIPADTEQKSRSFGLIGMRERAILLGGTFQITGIAGKGTSVLVSIPVKQTLADGGVAA